MTKENVLVEKRELEELKKEIAELKEKERKHLHQISSLEDEVDLAKAVAKAEEKRADKLLNDAWVSKKYFKLELELEYLRTEVFLLKNRHEKVLGKLNQVIKEATDPLVKFVSEEILYFGQSDDSIADWFGYYFRLTEIDGLMGTQLLNSIPWFEADEFMEVGQFSNTKEATDKLHNIVLYLNKKLKPSLSPLAPDA